MAIGDVLEALVGGGAAFLGGREAAITAELERQQQEEAFGLRRAVVEEQIRTSEAARKAAASAEVRAQEEFERQKMAFTLDKVGEEIAVISTAKLRGLYKDTPENLELERSLASMQSALLGELTGVEFPVFAPDLRQVPKSPELFRGIQDLFERIPIATTAEEKGMSVDEVAEEFAVQFGVPKDVIKILADPTLTPKQKSDQAAAHAELLSETLERASNNLNEILKDPQVRAWGENPATHINQKQAIAQALVTAGIAPESAENAANNLPIFTRVLTAAEEQDARTEVARILHGIDIARIRAGATVRAAEITGQARLGAANIAAVARVQAAEIAAGGDIPDNVRKARERIVKRVEKLTDPTKVGELRLPTQATTQLHKGNAEDLKIIFDEVHDIDIPVNMMNTISNVILSNGPEGWETSKSILANEFRAGGMSGADIDAVLSAVWSEMGIQDAGVAFGPGFTVTEEMIPQQPLEG